MLKVIAWILTIAIFVLLLVFSLNNLDPVTLNFIGGWSMTKPMIVVVLAVFAAGCVFGMFAMLPFAFKRRKQAKATEKKNVPNSAQKSPADH